MFWGIDSATRLTGWTAGVGDVRPETGAWRYAHVGDDLGELLHLFDRDLEALAARFPPTVVIYEAPILTPHDRLLPLRKIYSMGAHLELWCRRRGVLVQEESSAALKKALTGSHKADKDQMVAMAEKLGISLPEGPGRKDAADSFAAWLVAINHHAREHQPMWDRAIYSPRGALL